jgi:hypothetical protein
MIHRCGRTMRQTLSGCENGVEIVPVDFEARALLEE